MSCQNELFPTFFAFFSSRLFQFICSVLCLLLNLYLITAMVVTKKLRQLQFFPILLQAAADIVGCGIGGIYFYVTQVNSELLWLDYYSHHQIFSYHSWPFLHIPEFRSLLIFYRLG